MVFNCLKARATLLYNSKFPEIPEIFLPGGENLRRRDFDDSNLFQS